MERVRYVEHRGTRILNVDYSDLVDPDELHSAALRALAAVRAHEGGDLLVLANLSGVPHNLVTTAILQYGVAESRPHVSARALVGLTPEAAASFEVAVKLFGAPMARFDDAETALDWLVEQRTAEG